MSELDYIQMAGLNFVQRTGWSKGIENFPLLLLPLFWQKVLKEGTRTETRERLEE